MTHEEIEAAHYQRLNSYRQSAEYAAFASQIGAEVPEGELPSLLGKRWEIDEETYWHFLEVLPPMGWNDDTFYLREFSFDDITTKYSKEDGRYFCEFARFPEQKQAATQTPWGIADADSTIHVAPGITFYTTSSHGGYHLSPERIAEMPQPLRDINPFAGPGWYEEDADWSLVALSFPQHFPDHAIPAAMNVLQQSKPELYAELTKDGWQGKIAAEGQQQTGRGGV